MLNTKIIGIGKNHDKQRKGLLEVSLRDYTQYFDITNGWVNFKCADLIELLELVYKDGINEGFGIGRKQGFDEAFNLDI